MSKKLQEKNQKRQAENREHRISIKKWIKKFNKGLQERDPDREELEKLLSGVQSSLDKAAQKRVIHKNKSANKKSKLYQKLNKLKGQAEVE